MALTSAQMLERVPSMDGPAQSAFEITPHNTNDLATTARGLYVGAAGDVKVDTVAGDTVTFVDVPAGTILPVCCTRVYATGTVATDIVGLA
jgi:hypothetical protein